MLNINTLQKTMLDGMMFYCKAAFWSADIVQDQMLEAWKLFLEQNGKMQEEMEGFLSTWMLNTRQGREGLQLNLEKGLKAMEERLSNPGSGSWPLEGLYGDWPELQMEAMRIWMGLMGIPLDTAGGKGEKDSGEGQATKGK